MPFDEEFNEFAAAVWPRLVRGARLAGCDSASSEDVAQEALTKCWVKWRRGGHLVTHPEAYCYRVMMRLLWRHQRKQRTGGVSMSEHLLQAVAIEDATAWVELMDDLQRLSLQHRQVLVCRFYLDLSVAETADVLEVPEGTVKSRQARALKQLTGPTALTTKAERVAAPRKDRT